jgi:hypothetical protein
MTTHFNKTLFVTVIVSVVSIAGTTAGLSRPDTSRMTCAAAQALVVRHGGIVLDTGPSIFDRYVSSQAYCTSTELTEPAFVPTADNRQCFVGQRCRQRYGDR